MRVAAIVMVSAGALVLANGSVASAQSGVFPQYGNMNNYGNNFRGPQGFPTQQPLSPWLNMLRGGNSAANYFMGVQPEFDRRYFQAGVNAQLPVLQGAVQAAQQPLDLITGIPVLPQTGHLSAFQAYGMYYSMPGQQRPYYPLNPMQARMMPR